VEAITQSLLVVVVQVLREELMQKELVELTQVLTVLLLQVVVQALALVELQTTVVQVAAAVGVAVILLKVMEQ
jgi:hypothetical protein